MAWTINHMGGAGPGIDMSGFAQNAALRRQYAAQKPSFGAMLGAGLGQGFGQGMNLAIQDLYDQKREDRYLTRMDKREQAAFERQEARDKALAERQMRQAEAILQRQMLIEQEQAFEKERTGAYQAMGEYFTSTPSPDPNMRIEYEDITNDYAALTKDYGPQLPQDQVFMRKRELDGRMIQLSRRIPQQPPPEVEMLQSTISGQKLNEIYSSQIVGAGGGVGMPSPFDPSATYYSEIRNGAKRYVMLDGTGAEYQAKVQAQMAKAKSEASSAAPPSPPMTLGEWAMTGHPQAKMMLANGMEDPRTVATINPKTGMFDIQEGGRLPSPVEVQQDEREKAQKIADQKAADAEKTAADKASRAMSYIDKWRSERGTDVVTQKSWESVNGPSDPESLRAKAFARVEEEDRWKEQFKQQIAQKQQIDDALNTATEADMAEYQAIYQAMKAGGVQPGDEALFEELKARFGG